MPEITMPRLSDTMEDGVISAWLKQVGDRVTRGEVLAEIETDKALMELEAYDDGVLERIIFEAGARVPIGEPIAVVGDGSGTAASAQTPARTGTSDAPGPRAGAEDARPGGRADEPTGETAARTKSSPLARKVARELGIDIATVAGSGPRGRVIRQDVEAASRAGAATPVVTAAAPESEAATPPPGTDADAVALTTIQRISAQRLTESKQQAPHIYLTSVIDVTELLEFRTRVNATLAESGKVSINDLLVKAVAATLRANPAVNVSFAGEKLWRHRGVHLGVAVATPAGLMVPVIRDADRKSVSEIAAESRDKAGRARDRKLRPDDMAGATFTISNLGMFGIEHFTAVINPPEAAILAVGAATDELRLHDGQVVGRKILRVTMSADHRAIDGAVAAQFLADLKGLLEHPLRIVV
ncbi:dihydrolipoamide acetyltransferase family protein [Nocardia carnea]|uniref:dihydrolipoamide acetyltransferase family protein n=1 Tax=Nocardia carnea TaxID=37328 RepID=UPI0024556D3F|nr:dihydrolipoamide acetyltransferase family protein [Nocardia carnea]